MGSPVNNLKSPHSCLRIDEHIPDHMIQLNSTAGAGQFGNILPKSMINCSQDRIYGGH